MPNFSWNPQGGYWYPDPNGTATFASGSAAAAAPGPSGQQTTSAPLPTALGGTAANPPLPAGVAAAPGVPTYDQPSTGAPISSPTSQDPTASNQANQDALATLQNELNSWGLGSLSTWAWGEITSGKGSDQILYDLRQTQTYQLSIFGQTNRTRTANGLAAMSEADILSYQNQAMQAAHQAGLPDGFLTTTELAGLMGNDVSASELSERITQGYVAAIQAPPEVLDHLQTYYGVTPGNLAAYYLDPTKGEALLQKQFATAQIGGMAQTTGFGALDLQSAQYLQSLGVTQSQAQQGFGQLAGEAQITGALPGETAPQVSEDVQLGAQFGQNGADILAMKRAQQNRLSPFSGGGGFASTGAGLTGIGGSTQAG